jgi:hypothetical protein
MTVSRPLKVIVGALTIWPIVYMCLFIGFIVLSILAVSDSARVPARSDGPPLWFAALMLGHLGTIAITVAVTTFYIVYLFKTDRVEQSHKALWGVALFMGGAIAQPIFFWLYVWPERWPATEPPSLPRPASTSRPQ